MLRRYMSTAAKVAEQKRMSPQYYCTHSKCLWRVLHIDGKVTPCPRHPQKGANDGQAPTEHSA